MILNIIIIELYCNKLLLLIVSKTIKLFNTSSVLFCILYFFFTNYDFIKEVIDFKKQFTYLKDNYNFVTVIQHYVLNLPF